MNKTESAKVVVWLAVLYTVASFLHFTHNAEFLDEYPNLPGWISRSSVYITWAGIAVIGVVGYALFRHGREVSGLVVLALYACLGFDGLLHYTRAPFASHTTAMNVSILFEVIAAALLLIAVIWHRYAQLQPRVARTTTA
jgi:hypothetical protein